MIKRVWVWRNITGQYGLGPLAIKPKKAYGMDVWFQITKSNLITSVKIESRNFQELFPVTRMKPGTKPVRLNISLQSVKRKR